MPDPLDIDTQLEKQLAEKHARACLTKLPISLARNRDVFRVIQDAIGRALEEHRKAIQAREPKPPPPSV